MEPKPGYIAMLAENGNFRDMFWNDKKKQKTKGSSQSWSMDNNPASAVDHGETQEKRSDGISEEPLEAETETQDDRTQDTDVTKTLGLGTWAKAPEVDPDES
ncbi:uncharacterized protein Z520_00605 [Fonsecaea multimorphosa CBS 102226]|uniref:Uncharacterized protein n=1 Tax=Fonsecaea multimorphosa CBS 102226 TaxID=1442371 RepID=A0A0D2KCS5_9EURO|nr:uncharacterized protein Z520_00605 [Fonsecaea multimorphosa CBS 102226]KIY03913.1 hypothetical protein Z520_00605 [Fonsecaea multimorphosa CBS 102226]OAL31754.1 hypothetical protein AYO22_00624 [Fonsecaea multimorphosa]